MKTNTLSEVSPSCDDIGSRARAWAAALSPAPVEYETQCKEHGCARWRCDGSHVSPPAKTARELQHEYARAELLTCAKMLGERDGGLDPSTIDFYNQFRLAVLEYLHAEASWTGEGE